MLDAFFQIAAYIGRKLLLLNPIPGRWRSFLRSSGFNRGEQ
jgi:hypothetical protein